MSQVSLPSVMVGNEFIMPAPRLRVAAPARLPEPAVSLPIIPTQPVSHQEFIPVSVGHTSRRAPFQPLAQLVELFHHYSLAFFALLFLLVGATGVRVGGSYYQAYVLSSVKPIVAIKSVVPTIAGLNITVPSEQLQAKLQSITSQPASLTVGSQTVAISPDTIKSWLQITANAGKSQDYISIRSGTIAKSLADMANKFVVSPRDQVTATYADGSSAVIVAGHDGTQLSDPASLQQQAATVAKTVMDGKGLQFNTPLVAMPFASVTPAAFDKLIEVNVITKQMYLYDKGQLAKTYPISAGKPSTPTPIGEFRIFSKLPVEDMKGFNADGSKYLQPHVHWINYFLPGGYAVHGNYWRPLDWFGAINSSHGCVSLPDDQAKEVYDWAPLGTTVITHY